MVESRDFIIIDIGSDDSSDESEGDVSETNSVLEETKHAVEDNVAAVLCSIGEVCSTVGVIGNVNRELEENCPNIVTVEHLSSSDEEADKINIDSKPTEMSEEAHRVSSDSAGGETFCHSAENRVLRLKGDVNHLLQKNVTLRQKLMERRDTENKAEQTLADYKHMIQDKINLNLKYNSLENELQVLTQTKIDLHHSTVDTDGGLHKQVVRLQRENQRLRGDVEKLLQKIRMIESTGRPSWVGSTVDDEVVSKGGKDVPGSLQSVGGVTETPCHDAGDGEGQCCVRMASQWGVNRDHLIEYTNRFEGLEYIDFQGDQATLVFSDPRHAELFSRKRVHEFRGNVIMVASPL